MEQKTKLYSTPRIDVIKIKQADIITLSDAADNESNMPGDWMPVGEE